MEIRCRRIGEVTFLDLTGRCVVSAGEAELVDFRTTLAQLIAEGRVHVAANLENLKSIDARGIGEFIVAHKTLEAAGGELTLIAPNTRIRTMLSVTRLDTVLRLCRSTDEIGGAHRYVAPRPTGDANHESEGDDRWRSIGREHSSALNATSRDTRLCRRRSWC